MAWTEEQIMGMSEAQIDSIYNSMVKALDETPSFVEDTISASTTKGKGIQFRRRGQDISFDIPEDSPSFISSAFGDITSDLANWMKQWEAERQQYEPTSENIDLPFRFGASAPADWDLNIGGQQVRNVPPQHALANLINWLSGGDKTSNTELTSK